MFKSINMPQNALISSAMPGICRLITLHYWWQKRIVHNQIVGFAPKCMLYFFENIIFYWIKIFLILFMLQLNKNCATLYIYIYNLSAFAPKRMLLYFENISFFTWFRFYKTFFWIFLGYNKKQQFERLAPQLILTT